MPIRRLVLVASFATTCFCTSRAAADGAASPADQDAAGAGPTLLDLEELLFDLGFDPEYDRRAVVAEYDGRRSARIRQLNEAWRFEETVGMRARGDLFGERVLQFDVGGRWGISQESFFEKRPGPDLRDRPHGDILDYDYRFDILPVGKISGTVYGSQADDRIPRRFLPSLDRRRERHGAGLFLSDRVLPMRLTWERVFDEWRGGSNGLLDDEDRLQDTLSYELTWQPTEYHSLRLAYEYDQRKEKYSGSGTRFDTTRNYATLDHTLRFGAGHRHWLETLARFQDETGDLARDTYELAPHLRLQLTDSLATFVRGQYLRESFQQLRTQQWRGDVGLIHELGDTLVSTLSIYGLRQNTEVRSRRRGQGTDGTEWGGTGNLAFHRDNPLGRLSANLTYTHTKHRTTGGEDFGLVIAESVTFRDPQPAYLAKQNIERLSIVVTDAARTRTYVEGRDYFVIQIAGYTAIERYRAGQIADRETVAVSYTYRTAENHELARDRVDLRIQQDFKFGLTPYYAGSIQDEDLDRARYAMFRARNVNRHRVGATYRQPRWSLGMEYEYNDDAIDPFEGLHVNGDVILVDKARQQLTANGTFSRLLFDGSEDLRRHDTSLLDLGLNYRYLLVRDVELNASAAYRYEDDSLFGRTHGVDLTGSLAYKIGRFSALFEVEYDVLNLPASSDENVAVWLKLRREIPVIAKKRR